VKKIGAELHQKNLKVGLKQIIFGD